MKTYKLKIKFTDWDKLLEEIKALRDELEFDDESGMAYSDNGEIEVYYDD